MECQNLVIINTPLFRCAKTVSSTPQAFPVRPLYGEGATHGRRKRRRHGLRIAVGACLAVLILSTCAGALQRYCAADSQADEIQKELETNIEDKLGAIDFSSMQGWLNGLEATYNSFIGSDVLTSVKSVIKGDFKGGFAEFFNILLKSLGSLVLDFLPILVTVTAIALLYSMLEGMSSGFVAPQTREIIYFVCFSAMLVVVLVKVGALVKLTADTIGSMQSLMTAAFPILLTMITVLGGVTTSAVYKPMMSVLATTITMLVSKLIVPLFLAALAFCVVGNLSKNIKLDKLTKFFKSTATFVMANVFSLFVAFLSLQGLTGGMIDSVSIKTAKFAIQSYVPILGGYLSDGFDLVIASVVLIKNSVGFIVMMMIICAIVLPIIKIWLFALGLKLVSGIIEPICDERFGKTLYAISNNLTTLMSTIIGIGFMFLVTVMLIIYTCNLGVA